MKRIITCAFCFIFVGIAVIVGCATQQPDAEKASPKYASLRRAFDANKGFIDPSEVQVIAPAPSAVSLTSAPRLDEELWILPVEEDRGAAKFAPGLAFEAPVYAPAPSTSPGQAQAQFDQDAWCKTVDQRILQDIPGAGGLIAKVSKEQRTLPFPLKHTDVRASILGYISTVEVTQQYENPFSEKIEAVYVFPLPQDAAVSDFLMTIGDRKIRGIIREKAEAERIYNEAKRQGYVASLLTQQRPNIFTQSVANIEPGKRIDVNIKYFNTLQYVDGSYEFVFPMVVGPRFNPPGYKEGIGSVGNGNRGASGQPTEVQYRRPTERTGHDISLSVHIDAGVAIEKIESTNHRITTKNARTSADVMLASDDSIPNKDFVLRYKVAGDHFKSGLVIQRDPRGGKSGFFTLMLFPPDSLKDLPRAPVEMVFTLDVSGSMSGRPIEQSKAAIRYALTHMRPDDTFQVIRFASNSEAMSPAPLPATQENIELALRYIEQTDAGGGTMMLEGIRQCLNFPCDESRLRYVTFLTDGYIGNEIDIFKEIRRSRGDSRIFSFGVGSSTNRYLLDGMARFGAGTAAYLSLNDDANKVMAEYFDRISHPAMSDIAIDFGVAKASEIFPQRIPDLFVGRPVVITGRFTGSAPEKIRVLGRVGGKPVEIAVNSNATDTSAAKNALASVWARSKIAEISDRAMDAPSDVAQSETPRQIRQVALDYGLMSAYTAFIAVDSSQVTAGDHGTTVVQPVPVPDGVKYETAVQERAKEAGHAE